MNSPIKPLDMVIDEVIENEIDRWIEEKYREPEQIDLFEDIE